MKNPRLYIENTGTASKIIAGYNTKVFLLAEDADGVEQRVDISMLCRAVDVRLHIGAAVTANLEMFITGLETRAQLEDLVLRKLKPRRLRWRSRLRDITGFGTSWKEYA